MSTVSKEFKFITDFVRERSAIVLEPDKEYLVYGRLGPVVKEHGLNSLQDLVARLQTMPYGRLHKQVIEAMTTNETSFFRDLAPFEVLKERILPELVQKRKMRMNLNLWCGASSSGQEPYTVALLIKEYFPDLGGWNVKFIATDISTEMLDQARKGEYKKIEVDRGLSKNLLQKYFTMKDDTWVVNESVRKMIDFREMNLLGPWLPFPKLDIIFLRNVLIYFDIETKKTILGKIREILSPDGYLFLGGTETTMNLDDAFERVSFHTTSCYRLR